jgi:hypothetical protein
MYIQMIRVTTSDFVTLKAPALWPLSAVCGTTLAGEDVRDYTTKQLGVLQERVVGATTKDAKSRRRGKSAYVLGLVKEPKYPKNSRKLIIRSQEIKGLTRVDWILDLLFTSSGSPSHVASQQ